jgi:tRNA (guanine-N7-)-methyltransferase
VPPRRPSLDELRPLLLDVPHPHQGPHALPDDQPPQPLDWPLLFGNPHPVEIEVGFGKGLFLLNQSQARSEVNFLGIEIERKYVLLTAARLLKRGITNVRLACTDARWFCKHRVASASVAAVHVYFPDPWWKKRHHKRRVMTADFVEQIVRVLKPGGELHFASDVGAYFDETTALLAEQQRLQPRPLSELPAGTNDADYLTNFERKYRHEGRVIYRASYCRA